MKHLDLFSGIGGFALAAMTVWGKDYECVGFCDIEPYAQELLKIRFPGVPIYEDIKKLTAERIIADSDRVRLQEPRTEQQTGRNRPDNQVDLLTGGFPCQPFSMAGQRRGTEDDRYLWPEMLRVIKEVRPTWVIGENVFGLASMAIGQSEADLEVNADNVSEDNGDVYATGVIWTIVSNLKDIGYDCEVLCIPACGVNAPHKRDRLWFVAHTTTCGCEYVKDKTRVPQTQNGTGSPNPISNSCWGPANASHASNTGLQGSGETGNTKGNREKYGNKFIDRRRGGWSKPWLEVATRLCGMDDGLPTGMDGFKLSKAGHRVARLKGLGNAIVPQVVMEIMKAIKTVEEQ